MLNTLVPLLGIAAPSGELIFICVVGALIPTTFFGWMNWWLSSVKEQNPDDQIAAQQKADASHHGHPAAAKGQGHGHAHA